LWTVEKEIIGAEYEWCGVAKVHFYLNSYIEGGLWQPMRPEDGQ